MEMQLQPNKKILVTGGTGFLGAYIIKNLVEKNYSVRSLKRKSPLPFFIPEEIFSKVEWVDTNILDVVGIGEAMKDADCVIHSAAMVSFSKHTRSEMYKVNIEGTENIVNLALEHGLKKLIHVSSVAALGRTEKASTVTENRKWENNKSNTHYAITKHHAEMHAWRGFAEGLEGVIVNPSTILGFGNWHQSSCAIFKNAYKEFPWYSNGINGFVGVEDVAEIIVQLMESSVHQERFIVNGDNWSFRRLLDTLADGFGKKRPSREATRFLGSIAWRAERIKSFFTGRKPLLTMETAKLAQSKTSFDNSKILEALPGFSFSPLETVIKMACEKYQKALKEGSISL